MRRVRCALLAAAGLLVLDASGAEAACRATPDGAGGAIVRCDDGAAGRLRPDGAEGLRGVVGETPVRIRPSSGASSPTQSSPGSGAGASGRGSRESATGRAANPCMSGGVLRTDCN